LFISVLGWSIGLYSQHRFVMIIALAIGVWFYLKEPSMMRWWMILAFIFLMMQIIKLTFTFDEEGLFLVREKRATWMMVEQYFHRYYVPLDPFVDVEMGDIIKITGSLGELKITTYESMFSFKDFLNQRGVGLAVTPESIETILRFPFRFSSIIHERIDLLHPNVRDAVSQWLWNRSHPESTMSAWLEQVLGVSGFGFFLLWTTCQTIGQWFGKPYHVSAILMMLFFPFVLMNLHQWGIIRVYGIALLQWKFNKTTIHEHKMMVLAIMSIFNPYVWIQPGGQLYLVYQAWLGLIKPMVYRMPSYQRWLMMTGIALGWSWVSNGYITIIQSLLYAPLTMIQMVLVPGWIMYLYTGWLLPGLSFLTAVIVDVMLWIPVIPVMYLGEIPWYTLSVLTFILLTLSWVYTMHLTIYVQRLLITLLIVVVLHITGIDHGFIHEIHFINVGQGDATLVMSKGQSLLIDSGGVLRFDISHEVLIPYFKKLRIKRLDAVIITHDDFDHNGGLPSLVNAFPVNRVIDQPFDPFSLGQWTITNYQYFLDVLVEDNERSLIIGIANPMCQWLIMGDATTTTEEYLMTFFPDLQAKFLRIGHHGSLTSTSSALLDQLQPREAIISNGGGNRYGHPHPQVLERLQERNIRIRRTDQEGTIRYQTCKIGV
jgi:beta-lactamase superfamily II metal-dependent hydrolase